MPLRAQLKIIFIASAIITFSSTVSQAKNVFVFAVHRPLAMKNGEHPPKDIYINAGASDGLKSGETISIDRRQALQDMYKGSALSDLVMKVGEIRLIHVQPDISVGRVISLVKYDTAPAVDFDAIMVGDQVDMGSAHMGGKVAFAPRGESSSASVAPSPVLVASAPPTAMLKISGGVAPVAKAKMKTPNLKTASTAHPRRSVSSAPIALTP